MHVHSNSPYIPLFFIRNLEITDTFYFRYESIIEKKIENIL